MFLELVWCLNFSFLRLKKKEKYRDKSLDSAETAWSESTNFFSQLSSKIGILDVLHRGWNAIFMKKSE